MPRLRVTQTSCEGYGQIYVGAVNWMLMFVTFGLVLGFRKSDNLAAAYGIAVSGTMLATSVLLYFAMREVWGWGLFRAGAIAAVFVFVELAFFAANSTKFICGGYMPLVVAALVYGSMAVWHRGAGAAIARLRESMVPMSKFMEDIAQKKITRVPGTAVFLTRTDLEIPPVLAWHLAHNRSLHERLFILTVKIDSIPWVDEANRLTVSEVSPQFWRALARYGFMEHPDIPALLQLAQQRGCGLDLSDVTYYVGHETILPREDQKGLPHWMVAYFAFMQRNSTHLSDYFRLPLETTVEIGRQIAI
jgi:KUP system potassium uptake protein